MDNTTFDVIIWCAAWLLCAAMTCLCWFAAYCGGKNKKDMFGTFVCIAFGVFLQLGILNASPSQREAEALTIWNQEASIPLSIRREIHELNKKYPQLSITIQNKK